MNANLPDRVTSADIDDEYPAEDAKDPSDANRVEDMDTFHFAKDFGSMAVSDKWGDNLTLHAAVILCLRHPGNPYHAESLAKAIANNIRDYYAKGSL